MNNMHFLFTKTDFGYQSNYKNYNIKVSNGRITEISNDETEGEKYRFFNFGKTKVDIPQSVMDAVKAYAANN